MQTTFHHSLYRAVLFESQEPYSSLLPQQIVGKQRNLESVGIRYRLNPYDSQPLGIPHNSFASFSSFLSFLSSSSYIDIIPINTLIVKHNLFVFQKNNSMPNENNSLRNSLARYLLGRDFFAFGTAFAGGMCCKSLYHKELRQIRRAAFSISPYSVRVYVNPPIRGVNICPLPQLGVTQKTSKETHTLNSGEYKIVTPPHDSQRYPLEKAYHLLQTNQNLFGICCKYCNRLSGF